MGRGRFIRSVILFSFLMLEASCHKRQVLIPTSAPAPAPSAPAAAAPAPAARAPEPIPPPPNIAPTTPAPGAESAIPNPPLAPPPAPRPARKSARQPATPTAAPTAPAGAPSGAPAPQLGIVLTADQQRQYNSEIDQSLQRAEADLRSIANHQLTKEQQESVDEARNFIRQTQATRGSDLPGARRLAERAEVLARNLAASLR